MARPSKAPERTEQIVDATIRTITKYGYAGTTLDRIARESGLARGHIRHYVGNRQDLLKEAVRKYYFEHGNKDSIFPADTHTVQQAIDYLFSESFVGTREENLVMSGFLEAARNDAEISEMILRAYQGAEKDFAKLLRAEHPSIPLPQIKRISFAIISMAIHNIFLLDISAEANTAALARPAVNLMLESAIQTLTEKAP